MMRFAAVLFDLDGTLLDTLEDIASAANAALRQHGFPAHPVDDYRLFVGEGVRVLLHKALPEGSRSDAIIDACAESFRDAYERSWNVRTRPYPGIVELLTSLSARGMAMAVLSNKPDRFTKRCIAEYFPEFVMSPVLGQREGVPRKPDPAAAWEIARELALPPERFVYLGDSAVDMQTAVAAGMYPVGALWGFRSEAEILSGGALATIERPEDLRRMVDAE